MNSNDKYICLNCATILNEQSGFDVDNGSLTCTECSQELYGNAYEGGCCNNIHAMDEALVRDATFKEKVFARWEKVNPKLKKVGKWTLISIGVLVAVVVASKVSKNGDTDEEEDEVGFQMGNNNDYEGETCRWCGSPLIADEDGPDDRGTLRYECSNSNCYGVFFSDNGDSLLSPDERRKPNATPCSNCGMSLSGGEYTAPWENGNNPDGYIKCPHCGYVIFQWNDD